MNVPSKPASARLPTLVLALCMLASTTQAQPSGGPYGPVDQMYEVPSEGTVQFAAPGGDPEAAGTSLAAPTSIESAIARVITGDTIVLRGGVYRTGNLELNQGITIQPYGREKPILKGTCLVVPRQEQPLRERQGQVGAAGEDEPCTFGYGVVELQLATLEPAATPHWPTLSGYVIRRTARPGDSQRPYGLCDG